MLNLTLDFHALYKKINLNVKSTLREMQWYKHNWFAIAGMLPLIAERLLNGM